MERLAEGSNGPPGLILGGVGPSAQLYAGSMPLVGRLVHAFLRLVLKEQLGNVPSASYPVKTAMTPHQHHNFLCG